MFYIIYIAVIVFALYLIFHDRGVNGNCECSIFGKIECSVFRNSSTSFSVTMMQHFS